MAVERSGFKRRLFVPGVVLTALEAIVIVLPLLYFYRPTPSSARCCPPRSSPVALGFVAVWALAITTWLAPLQRAVSLRKKNQPLLGEITDAAYRALLLAPNRLWVLRTTLWTVSLSVLASLLYALTSFPLQAVATVIGVTLMNSLMVSLLRSSWTARVLRQLKPVLFPWPGATGCFRRHLLRSPGEDLAGHRRHRADRHHRLHLLLPAHTASTSSCSCRPTSRSRSACSPWAGT